MKTKDDAAALFKAIRRIVRAIDLRSREVARVVGLTIPQIVVLQAARDLGKVTTKAISQQSDLSAATVVMILEKLEDKGLVERHRSPEDRRIVHTLLTPGGEEILKTAPPMLHDEFYKGFAALSQAEQGAILSAMEKVAELMNANSIEAASILITSERPL